VAANAAGGAGCGLRLHPRLHPGYYDQTLHQLADNATLLEALEPSNPLANAVSGR
jgi:hypothetical protein